MMIAMTKKDDNVHDDDEKDEENVVSYEISSETLTRRGWSQQAKLEQEGRKKSTLSTILCRARLFHLMFFNDTCIVISTFVSLEFCVIHHFKIPFVLLWFSV